MFLPLTLTTNTINITLGGWNLFNIGFVVISTELTFSSRKEQELKQFVFKYNWRVKKRMYKIRIESEVFVQRIDAPKSFNANLRSRKGNTL